MSQRKLNAYKLINISADLKYNGCQKYPISKDGMILHNDKLYKLPQNDTDDNCKYLDDLTYAVLNSSIVSLLKYKFDNEIVLDKCIDIPVKFSAEEAKCINDNGNTDFIEKINFVMRKNYIIFNTSIQTYIVKDMKLMHILPGHVNFKHNDIAIVGDNKIFDLINNEYIYTCPHNMYISSIFEYEFNYYANVRGADKDFLLKITSSEIGPENMCDSCSSYTTKNTLILPCKCQKLCKNCYDLPVCPRCKITITDRIELIF